MTMSPSLVCIIVNYNTDRLAVSAVKSVLPEIEALCGHIILVDNCSPNGDGPKLREAVEAENWLDWVTVIQSNTNGGFGAGNNIGHRYIESQGWSPHYLYLLNPDTHVKEQAILRLVETLNQHPNCAAVGSQLEAQDGHLHTSAFRFPTVGREFVGSVQLGVLQAAFPKEQVSMHPGDQSEQVDWVAGASVLFSYDVFHKINGFDEQFFLYYEEVDLMLRLQRAGYETWYEPTSRVIHQEGQSTGLSHGQTSKKQTPSYWFDSWRHYYSKNHGRTYAVFAAVARCSGQALALVHRGIRFKGTVKEDIRRLGYSLSQCLWRSLI